MIAFFLKLLLFLVAVFMILLILVQRGKGGGLAGAFGGMGGQSAFGTKAGDTFTRVTIGVAAFWIVLCVISIPLLGPRQELFEDNAPPASGPASTDTKAEAESTAPAPEAPVDNSGAK